MGIRHWDSDTWGLIEHLFQSNESMNELPTDALNGFLRRLLGRRIYERFVEPGVIDAQEDYWPERAAGNRWMARWVLVRAYGSIRSVVLLVKALV